jgi:hypothetical protein
MVKKSCWQVVPTILTLALVACEGSIMGVADPEVDVADPEVEFEAVSSIAAMEQPPEDLVGGNDVVERGSVDGWINFSVMDTNNPFNADGEVTAWEVFNLDAFESVQLVIFRKTDTGFLIVGTSGSETPVAGLNQFTTDPIPVLAGDFVGLVNYNVKFDITDIDGADCAGDLTRAVLISGNRSGLSTNFVASCNRIYSVRATGTVTPTNQPPVGNAGGPYTGPEGSPVVFDGSGSSDPDDDPLTFDWNFSDPSDLTSGSGPTPSHTYVNDGVFEVNLTVTDPAGATNVAATTVEITNVSPTVGPVTGPVEPVLVGTEVTVGTDFTDPGPLDTHYGTIDWGDGSVLAADLTETGGSGSVSGIHTYTTPGAYTVQVSVADDDGGTGASILELVVEVEIDIKPGSDQKCFNNNGRGVIPVAILGTVDFDVTELDPATVELEGLSVMARGRRHKLRARFDDVSGPNGVPDGFIDLVVQIKGVDGTFARGSSTATLRGYLFDGTEIVGRDDICVVWSRNSHRTRSSLRGKLLSWLRSWRSR